MNKEIIKDSEIKLMDSDKLKEILKVLEDTKIADEIMRTLKSAGNEYIKFGMKAKGELSMIQNIDKGGGCFSFLKALKEIIKNNSAIEIDNENVIQDISRFSIIIEEMIKRKLPIAEGMISLHLIVRSNIKNYGNILDAYQRSY